LRFGVRVIRRMPILSATIILTLGLVIGATSSVFSLADAVLVRPLPYPAADRLGIVVPSRRDARGASTGTYVNGAMWEAVRDRTTKLDAAPYWDGAGGVNFVSGGTASFAQEQRVASGFFRVIGVQPFMGREFTRDEDRAGGPPVAVLSREFW